MLVETQRLQTLAAMGIDVYLLRTRDAAATSDTPAAAALAPAISAGGAQAESPTLVVACARSADADVHAARLRSALPLALGVAAARIAWIEPDAAGVLALPATAAPAYLALGTDLARALGEQLSTMQQMSAVIAVADAPRACLGNGLARRVLWQALKPIARHLRRGAA
jgi:hypothetical protein